MRLPSMSVRPSVCQQDYSKTRAWIWMKFLRVDRCREHGRTDQLLNPIRIIVRMPEPENLKVEDLWTSVKQAPHSEQVTGHGMHCREILFTPRCSLRARESVRRTVAELRGVKLPQFSDFGLCRRYMRSTECPSSYLVFCNLCNNFLLVSAYISIPYARCE